MTASRPAAMALSPLLVRQARRVRQRTPRLPEASGDRTGIELTADATNLLRLLVVGESTAAGVGRRAREGLIAGVEQRDTNGQSATAAVAVTALPAALARLVHCGA
jgi:hypothetical protein